MMLVIGYGLFVIGKTGKLTMFALYFTDIFPMLVNMTKKVVFMLDFLNQVLYHRGSF